MWLLRTSHRERAQTPQKYMHTYTHTHTYIPPPSNLILNDRYTKMHIHLSCVLYTYAYNYIHTCTHTHSLLRFDYQISCELASLVTSFRGMESCFLASFPSESTWWFKYSKASFNSSEGMIQSLAYTILEYAKCHSRIRITKEAYYAYLKMVFFWQWACFSTV